MKRRTFLSTAIASTAALKLGGPAVVFAQEAEVCVPGLDFVSAEATYFSRYQHFHLLSIPVDTLIAPPSEGFTTRTSLLDQASLDNEAFMQFIKESGIDEKALRHHSHQVKFTKEELDRIASGEKEVKITVNTPKGNLGHYFYFTASPSALARIKYGRK